MYIYIINQSEPNYQMFKRFDYQLISYFYRQILIFQLKVL